VVVKRTITLEIAGTRFRLVSDADQDHLQELASMINERVEKLNRSGARSASSGQLLALAALELADELKSSRAKLQHVEQLTRSTIANAIARIDTRLSEG
jgi:cell division protein ZapA (FtsZ GTPase activity inhibitor)